MSKRRSRHGKPKAADGATKTAQDPDRQRRQQQDAEDHRGVGRALVPASRCTASTSAAPRKFLAHDENNESQEGDMVAIAQCRPLSRHKAWRLVKVVSRAAPGLKDRRTP